MHTKLSLYCEKVIEAGWLAVIVLVPVFFNIYSARTFEPDKITLMRSIALVMALAWLIKVAEAGFGLLEASEGRDAQDGAEESEPGQSLWQRLKSMPLLVPTLLVVAAYLISTVLSISPRVALWGSYQRLQGAYTALSYIVIFALVASHLRTRAQVDRLLTVVIVTSLPVALYGIVQRYGLDPLPWAGDVQSRVAANMGNAIFVAAYLIMAVPPILSRLVKSMSAILREEDTGWANTVLAAVYIFILAVDLIAIIFSGSRGPLLGLLAGLFYFVFLGVLSRYRHRSSGLRLSFKPVVSSLMEVVLPLLVGAGLGFAWAAASSGSPSLGGKALDTGAAVALGLLLGVALAVLVAVVRLAIDRGSWRLWLNWVFTAVVVAGLLISFNVPQSPLSSLRSAPTVGRLATLFQSGSGTGRVRVLIWEGVLNLISPHEPLGAPGEFVDTLNPVRPVVGYGPESMFNAFAHVYPPELAHVEARGSSADRSHNETFDFLATLGIFGFLAYYLFIFSLYYYMLRAVGWIPNRAARRRLMIMLGVGGLLGVAVPRIVVGDFVFSALGLPAGMLGMILVYLIWQAVISQPDAAGDTGEQSTSDGQDLVIIGIFAALVAHFVEVHFVFSIAATYVYFWVFAGVVVAWLYGAYDRDAVAYDMAVGSQGRSPGGRRSDGADRGSARRTRRGGRRGGESVGQQSSSSPSASSGGREDWETWLGVFGLVIALILVTMIFDFVTSQFDVSRGNFSMVWMFSITWLIGMAIGLGEVAVRTGTWMKPLSWGRALLLYAVTSLGYPIFYLIVHRWNLRPRTALSSDALQAIWQGAGVVTTAFLLFYAFVFLLLLLMAGMLAAPLFSRQIFWRKGNWWLYPVMIVAAVVAVLFKNVDVVRADMMLKQGEQYRNQQQYDAAVELHRRAVQLDPDEDFYYLMLALDYQLKAQDGRFSPEQRAQAWAQGEQIALEAREINIYNPDNTGNMGRYYLTWAQVTPADDPQRATRFAQAEDFFKRAIHLAPQNVVYYNLLAQTYYILGQYAQAEEVLQQSESLDPRFDQTQMLLGDTYGAMGRPEDAARAHSKAILRNPSVFADQFLDQRINFYISYPQMDDIVAALVEAGEERPKDPVPPRTVGHIYSRLGDLDQAEKYYEEAVSRGDKSVQTQAELAAAYLAAEDFENAVRLYEQIVAQAPDDAQVHSNLGYAYARLGRLEEAIRENQRVLELTPGDHISHRNLVLLYRDSGQQDQAIAQAQQMMETAPAEEMGQTYLLLGSLYEGNGQIDEALNAYQQAVAATPSLAQGYAALGNAYLTQGRIQEALDAFLELAALTPDDYAVRQQVAVLYHQLGQTDEALQWANEALALAPDDARTSLEDLVSQLEAESGGN
jgi:tetratricopeptide (TPR) repeat protein